MRNIEYGETEINYLKNKDKVLAEAIDRIGFVKREVIPDLFAALMNSIVGQQISTKAFETIWRRMLDRFGDITPERIEGLSEEELQSVGITMKKAVYMKDIAAKVTSGEFKIDEIAKLPDEALVKQLSSLKGVGVWTAEMLMIFSLERKNILSWDDLAIRRGIMMLYHHRKLDKDKFEKYRRRYSPYGTVASLYLWEISLGK